MPSGFLAGFKIIVSQAVNMELIGLIVFFVVVAVSLPLFVNMQQDSLMELRASATAGQFNKIAEAANNFILANYYSLEGAGGGVISIQELKDDGYLAPYINPVNPYGGTWEVYVVLEGPTSLQGILTTSGGMTLNQSQLGTVIAQTHGVGGEVPPFDLTVSGSGDVAYGAYNGWELNLPPNINPGFGHIVGLLNYENGALLNNDYLYRSAIPNHKELNTMQTDIEMGGNGIKNFSILQSSYNASGNCSLDSSGHCVGEIMAAGTLEGDLPSNWQGGVVTRDMYSKDGTIAVGPGSNYAEYVGKTPYYRQTIMNNNPNYTNSGVLAFMDDDGPNNVSGSGGWIGAMSPTTNYWTADMANDVNGQGGLWTGGPQAAASIFSQDGASSVNTAYYTTSGTQQSSATLYSSADGPGMYMVNRKSEDYVAISAPNDTSQTGGLITNGAVEVAGSANSVVSFYATNYGVAGLSGIGGNGQFNLPTSDAQTGAALNVSGQSCSPNGAIGADYSGNTLSCVNGVWSSNSPFNFQNRRFIGTEVDGDYGWPSPFSYPTIVETKERCGGYGAVSTQICTKNWLCWSGLPVQQSEGNGFGFDFSNIVPANGIIFIKTYGTCGYDSYVNY